MTNFGVEQQHIGPVFLFSYKSTFCYVFPLKSDLILITKYIINIFLYTPTTISIIIIIILKVVIAFLVFLLSRTK